MRTSDAIDLIAPALVKVQSALPKIRKDSANPHYRSSYLSLEGLLEATRPALLANGLALLQSTTDGDDAGLTVTTRLLHTSGQWIEGGVRLPLEKPTPQAAGSAFSYGKRYGLEAILGITGSEDDDANGAEVHQANQRAVTRPVGPPVEERAVRKVPRPAPDALACPKCGGTDLWDNRPKKASGQFKPNSPDFKCKDKACGGVIWPDDKAAVPVGPAFDDVPEGLQDDDGLGPLPF